MVGDPMVVVHTGVVGTAPNEKSRLKTANEYCEPPTNIDAASCCSILISTTCWRTGAGVAAACKTRVAPEKTTDVSNPLTTLVNLLFHMRERETNKYGWMTIVAR